ncbi:hypothetical protein MKW94_004880 [Papaver nudicaule]|uniref:Bet v I/Major latex protein domain-containing protein n=1 Tax=Papaver nudicaule TaxID=74823 RepID=A0AA41RQR9_PAPNU|nr:hypothetical protein [Papaver nudicaule]
MRFEFINEFEAHAPADDVWAFYSSPNYPKQVVELLPTILETKEILEGDGHSVGTVIRVVYLPGYVPHTYNEKIVTVDHGKRLKEVQQIEGGYLDMGFTYCMVSHEILAKECNSCIIKSAVHAEINDEAANGSIIHNTLDGYVALARAVSKHIGEQHAKSAN